MNSPLEILIQNGLLFDVFGILGIGLIAFAAVRLARRYQSWGGTMMALGALALLIGRLYLMVSPHFLNDDLLERIGPVGISMTYGLPPILLTFGLAGVVWGLWGHERWLRENS